MAQPGGPGPHRAELGGLGLMSRFLSFPGTFLASSLFLEESLERARTAQAIRAQTDDGKPRRGACDCGLERGELGALERSPHLFLPGMSSSRGLTVVEGACILDFVNKAHRASEEAMMVRQLDSAKSKASLPEEGASPPPTSSCFCKDVAPSSR